MSEPVKAHARLRICENCACFYPLGDQSDQGECRRRAPFWMTDPDVDPDDPFSRVWPKVFVDDWCFEHEALPAPVPVQEVPSASPPTWPEFGRLIGLARARNCIDHAIYKGITLEQVLANDCADMHRVNNWGPTCDRAVAIALKAWNAGVRG